jgi:hypothetical protein
MHDAATGAKNPAASGFDIGWRLAEMISPSTPKPLPPPMARFYDVDQGDHCTHREVPSDGAIDSFGRGRK